MSVDITNQQMSLNTTGEESRCTDICAKLTALKPLKGKLLNHDELLAALASEEDKQSLEHQLEEGIVLGTLQELRQRRSCPFCQLVLAATNDVENEGSQSVANQPVRLLLFPGEQSFRLSYPSRLGTNLAFVAQNDSQISGPDAARLVSTSRVDPSRVLSWLKKCEEHHGATCYPLLDNKGEGDAFKTLPDVFQRNHPYNFQERATSNFRVIDLELECIVPQTLDAKYVALSYVWGQLPMFRLLKSNVDKLSRKGGLTGVLPQLPRTLLDAMQFVKALGLRYLWVDALCLIQDDKNDVEVGIEVMNSIYQGSYFTIIAASGTDATSGLPGVRSNSRSVTQTIVNLDPSGAGLGMTVQHSIDWHLKRSVYKQRGWTLQELVLPRRTVIFINNQVYFRCQEANWAEETTADAFTHHLDPDDGNISRIPDPLDGGVQAWWAYQKLLEEFSSREIRFDGDALRAVAGILRPLCAGMDTRMMEGLPGHYLDNAVLFISSRGDMRRRPGFASCSWAGWSGSVMWPRENYVWYDEDGNRTWDTTNLFRWFAGKTFINWSYISVDAQQCGLMHDPYKGPSRMGVLVKAISDRYRQYADLLGSFDAAKLARYPDKYCSASGFGPFYENWSLSQKRRNTTHATFDLVNSQVEFERLVRNIDPNVNRGEYNFLMNWMASRNGQVRRSGRLLEQSRGKEGGGKTPKSIGRVHDRVHYRFRRDDEIKQPREDAREEHARRYFAEQSNEKKRKWKGNEAKKGCPDASIPKFPLYAVLSFQTLSISLVLGQVPEAEKGIPRPNGKNASSFHRIPGIPLLSPSSKAVGSLHADSLVELPASGTSIEFILMSHCQELTWNSALGTEDGTILEGDAEEPRPVGDGHKLDLFWALYIVWNDGIAERRGVAQLLSNAVGECCAPGPEIKDILLG